MQITNINSNIEFKALKTYPKIDKWDNQLLCTITSIPRIRQAINMDKHAKKNTFMSIQKVATPDLYNLKTGEKIDTTTLRFIFKSGLDGLNGCKINITCREKSESAAIKSIITEIKQQEVHDPKPPANPIEILETISGKIIDYIEDILK